MYLEKMVSTKILNSTTLIIIRNVQHIRMISEGSCDTEDWSDEHYIFFLLCKQMQIYFFLNVMFAFSSGQ